ncbi:MAG TPA: isocitrate lyase/phosphoenolpyruvate mutase family protein, partial [Paracoccaceae bacterium]|nr:isocitrate lyase/phosphoenolpyruvate mutase family protein [Paracoccaceae bacterium]
MTTRDDKVARFRALHRPGRPLLMPNPWDLGSARMLAALGAQALATTSSGHAFTLGRPDMGHVGRDEALAHAAAVAVAVAVPVNGDTENCYARDPDLAAETVGLAAGAGLAGCSIEDTDLPGSDAYPFDLALARVQTAVAAAREANIVLTARADGVLTRAYDAAEAVRRSAAFAEAGADVIYAPLVELETLAELCRIGVPVNALATGRFARHTVDEYARLGVA